MPQKEEPAKRNGIRTCLDPSCNRKIYYDVPLDGTPIEVPLYCPAHRSATGRHSRTVMVSASGSVSRQSVFHAEAAVAEGKRRRDYP